MLYRLTQESMSAMQAVSDVGMPVGQCFLYLGKLFGEETIQFHHFSAPIASPTLARVPSDIKRQLESLKRHSLHQAQDGSPPSNIKRDRQPQQPQE